MCLEQYGPGISCRSPVQATRLHQYGTCAPCSLRVSAAARTCVGAHRAALQLHTPALPCTGLHQDCMLR